MSDEATPQATGQGSGRGGRTATRSDASAMQGAVGAGASEEPLREVRLGKVENAIVKDLTRWFWSNRKRPVPQDVRDEIVGWHGRTPGAAMVHVLRTEREAIQTIEEVGSVSVPVVPYTSGVVFICRANDERWEPEDLKGQKPGHDGKLRGDQGPAEVVWPSPLKDGPWIMPPDTDQVVLRSDRRQSAYEALRQLSAGQMHREFVFGELMEALAAKGISSAQSVIRDFKTLGLLYVTSGKMRSRTDPSKYVVVLRPFYNRDGELETPPECQRWQELVAQEPEEEPEPPVPTAPSSPRVKTPEELQGEIDELLAQRERVASEKLAESTQDLDEQIASLTTRREELDREIAELIAARDGVAKDLEDLDEQRAERVDAFSAEGLPEITHIDEQIEELRTLLRLYARLVVTD